MNKYKVTIVVPVYNINGYIRKCLDSLASQTYDNLEILLIDDGSTDGSEKVCDEYAKSNCCFKVVHKENGGVSSARNVGIENANGDYILFVDGDDWIDSDYVRKMIQHIETDGAIDFVITAYKREFNDKAVNNYLFDKSYIEFSKEMIYTLILRRLYGLCDNEVNKCAVMDDFSPPWAKLVRTSIIKKYKFLHMKDIGTEDGFFNLQWIKDTNKAIYDGSLFYHYNKSNETSLIRSYKFYLFDGWKRKYSLMRNEIFQNSYDDTFDNALNNRIILDLFGVMRNLLNSNLSSSDKKKEFMRILNDEVYDDFLEKFPYKNLDFKWYVFYNACKNKKYYLVYVILHLGEKLKKIIKK